MKIRYDTEVDASELIDGLKEQGIEIDNLVLKTPSTACK